LQEDRVEKYYERSVVIILGIYLSLHIFTI